MILKILIVEKEQDLEKIIENGLRLVCDQEGCSCEFVTISDGSIVADIHKVNGFDLIIIDILDGMKIIKQIRKFDTVVALIAIVENPTLEVAIEAIQHNVCAFLKKPFTLSELSTQAQNAVARSLLRRKIYAISQQDVLKRHHHG